MPVENSKQLLKKVMLTSNTGNLSYDLANYEYNSEGRIIVEGNKVYVRDEIQRIIRVLEPVSLSNRVDIRVYYTGPGSEKIAYTLCNLENGSARDSIVYVHDAAGRLVKKLSYFSELSADNLPVGTYLAHYDIFSYDETGNLRQFDFYNIYQGNVYHCGQYQFSGYDNRNNPQYAEDEVRAMEYFGGGLMNASKNNFTRGKNLTKTYTYRADGKPLTCAVRSATESFTLKFEYE